MAEKETGTEMAFVDGTTEAQEAELPQVPMDVKGATDNSSFIGKAWEFAKLPAVAVRQQLSRVRPWNQFFEREQFAVPEGFGDAVSRLRCNVGHFYHNYFVVAFLGTLIVLITNPVFSICMILMLLMWAYTYKKQAEAAETNIHYLAIGGYGITFFKAYICITVFGLFTFFMFNGSSVLFWLVMASLGAVTTHAVSRKPPSEHELDHFV